jgi:orotidine-5'-phosphate decarboxylase
VSRDYVNKLCEDVRAKHSPLVLGIDPRPSSMPQSFQDMESFEGILGFYERLMDVLAERVVGVKPQIAFFEALGPQGFALYAQVCQAATQRGLTVIGDVKRGDIGSTAEAYARAHFEWADCLTVNPYLGEDSIAPFLDYCGRNAGRASGGDAGSLCSV